MRIAESRTKEDIEERVSCFRIRVLNLAKKRRGKTDKESNSHLSWKTNGMIKEHRSSWPWRASSGGRKPTAGRKVGNAVEKGLLYFTAIGPALDRSNVRRERAVTVGGQRNLKGQLLREGDRNDEIASNAEVR